MNLEEALAATGGAQKHVDEPVAGTYTVDKANMSSGYYQDFHADDPAFYCPFSTSFYWGKNELSKIAHFAGEDGWESR